MNSPTGLNLLKFIADEIRSPHRDMIICSRIFPIDQEDINVALSMNEKENSQCFQSEGDNQEDFDCLFQGRMTLVEEMKIIIDLNQFRSNHSRRCHEEYFVGHEPPDGNADGDE